MVFGEKFSKNLTLVFLFLLVLVFVFVGKLYFGKYFRKVEQLLPQNEKSIVLNSEMPGYDIKFINENLLRAKLDEIGFWSENGISNYNDKNKKFTAKKITINLVNKVENPFSEQVNDRQQPILTMGVRADELGYVDVKIYVDPNMKKSPNTSLGQFFDYGFWKSIYMITGFKGISTDKIDGGLSDEFTSKMVSESVYFQIDKI
jgi:hypothetical protein